MLTSWPRLLPAPARQARPFSLHSTPPLFHVLSYRVPRNTRGSIPVFTDIRNGGTRTLTLIRNVEGNIDALAKDLALSLFPPGTPEAARMKIHSIRSKHLVLSGGLWKNEVTRWLLSKGF